MYFLRRVVFGASSKLFSSVCDRRVYTRAIEEQRASEREREIRIAEVPRDVSTKEKGEIRN